MTIPKRKPTPHGDSVFSIDSWGNSRDGGKYIIYGEPGIGKSTMAIMAPDPVFIGLDDGAKRLRNPNTGEHQKFVSGIKTFEDYRKVLQTPELFKGFKTIVTDTATELQKLAIPFVFKTNTVKNARVKSLEEYGYGRGYGHLVEAMRLVLTDCDALVKQGFNIVFLAQLSTKKKADAGNTDYLQEGPDLFHNNQHSVRNEFVSWADYVVKLGLLDVAVTKDGKATSSTNRVAFASPAPHYIAKLRGLPQENISFADPSDDSLWILTGGDNNEG